MLFPVMLVARLLFTTMLGPLDRVALRDALRFLFVNASLFVARTAFVNRRLKTRRNVKSCSSVTCAFWELTSRRAALLCMLSYSLIIVFRQLVLLMQSSTASSQQRNTNHTHKGWRCGDLFTFDELTTHVGAGKDTNGTLGPEKGGCGWPVPRKTVTWYRSSRRPLHTATSRQRKGDHTSQWPLCLPSVGRKYRVFRWL